MNLGDIDALQERINRIAIDHASPEIIMAPKGKVNLREYIMKFQANRCTLSMLYNEFRRRIISFPIRSPTGNITFVPSITNIAHIIASISTDPSMLEDMITYVYQAYPSSEFNISIEKQSRDIYEILSGDSSIPMNISGVPSIPIHRFISNNAPRGIYPDIKKIYTILKSTINMNGKLLSIQSIVGGIVYAYSTENIYDATERSKIAPISIPNPVKQSDLYTIFQRLEPQDSPYSLNQKRFDDASQWYRDQVHYRIEPSALSFYSVSLKSLLSMAEMNLQIYPPTIEVERMIIRPLESIDLVDTMSHARTSPSIPLIIANTSNGIIIKVYNKPDTLRKIKLSWFMDPKNDLQDNTMNIVVRISRYPEKYQIIQYNGNKNYFSINRSNKHISTSSLITMLCTQLSLSNLTMPQISSTTYSFVSNYIEAINMRGATIFGLDRHVLAWLIMNPPSEYKALNLQQYVYVKEDNKPNALRDHISIHIQLGSDKLYLTLSQHDTTSGTLVPTNSIDSSTNESLVGFIIDQRYLRIRINKAQSIHHARIAQSIYNHLINMYIKYFDQTVSTILSMVGNIATIPMFNPTIVPLLTRIPSLREKYAFIDPSLYTYVSNINPDTLLPVPIDRDEVSYWKSRMHSVIRLPTIVTNNPLIQFETSNEIWLRTSEPEKRFVLIKKTQGGYIPIQESKNTSGLPIDMNEDMTIRGIYIGSAGKEYEVKHHRSMADPKYVGRRAFLTNAITKLLSPIVDPNEVPNLFRVGISMNPIDALNVSLRMNRTNEDVSQYAYLCLQECWTESVTEIEEDILSQRIILMKHYRALEMAYSINIYFIMDDQLEPFLRKPPHMHFHLHRRGNPLWDSIIFHSLSREPDSFTLIGIKNPPRSIYPMNYRFKGVIYLDKLFNANNRIRMISPSDDIDQLLETVPIQMKLGEWIAIEQIVDTYGKCRAITYSRNEDEISTYATINIGFAPIQNLPIGDIHTPTMNGSLPLIISDMRLSDNQIDASFADSIESLILRPTQSSVLSEWTRIEKEARIMRIVAYLLYNQMDISIDEFSDMIEVDPDISYDLSQLRHALPNGVNAWEYFSNMIPTMVMDGDTQVLIVPSEETKNALLLHIKATPKIQWPISLPSYVRYSWDINTGRDEQVFLHDVDLVQYLLMIHSPDERTTIIASPSPYILSRSDRKYLIQMARDIEHAKYIAYRWNTDALNPGYEGIIMDVDYPLNKVQLEFTEILTDISYTIMNDRVFVIIPLA